MKNRRARPFINFSLLIIVFVVACNEQKPALPDGFKTEYYENGQLKYIQQFSDGQETGIFAFYYPSGQIEKYGNMKNGKIHGAKQFFYESGMQMEVQCINKGFTFQIVKFDNKGEIVLNTAMAYCVLKSDTILLDEKFKADLGVWDNRVGTQLTVGSIVEFEGVEFIYDTMQVFESKSNLYNYEILCDKVGPQVFSASITKYDTCSHISIGTSLFTKEYYVLEKK